MPHEQLLEYLKTDNSELRIENKIAQRREGRLTTLIGLLTGALLLSILIFCLTLFLVAQEHTKQVQAMHSVEWAATVQEEIKGETKEHKTTATQEGIHIEGGGGPVYNVNSAGDSDIHE